MNKVDEIFYLEASSMMKQRLKKVKNKQEFNKREDRKVARLLKELFK